MEEAELPFSKEELDSLKGLYSEFWDREDHTQHALFRDVLPENFEEDPTLMALQQINEGALQCPADVLDHWKKVGNEHFADAAALPRRYHDAIDAYTKALQADGSPDRPRHPKAEPEYKEPVNPLDKEKARVLCNRAICYYRLGKYNEALEDTQEAIKKDPKFVKGYFHSGRACVAMGVYARGLRIVDEGIEYLRRLAQEDAKSPTGQTSAFEADVEYLKTLRGDIEKLVAKRESERALVKAKDEASRSHLERVLNARQIKWVADAVYDVPLDGPTITANNLVAWSILFLVDEFGACEGIDKVEEGACLQDIYNVLFKDPFPWDEGHVYSPESIVTHLAIDQTEDYLTVSNSTPIYELVTKCRIINKFLVCKLTRQ